MMKRITILLLALAAFLALGGCSSKPNDAVNANGTPNTPDGAAERFLNAVAHFDYDAANNESVIDIGQLAKAGSGIKNYKKLLESQKETIPAQWKQQFGDDYRVDIKVLSLAKLSSSETQNELTAFKTKYKAALDLPKLIDFSKISEIASVKAVIAIAGSKAKTSNETTIYCAKYDGAWKILDSPDFT